MKSPARRTIARRTVVSLLVAFGIFCGPALVSASQVPAMTRIFVSNNPDDWSATGQPIVDTAAPATVFVVFGSSAHSGFTFQGQCVFNLVATRAELFRISIPPIAVNPGQDMVRSDVFSNSWPNAAVEVTCVADHNAAWAYSTVIGTESYAAGQATGGNSGTGVTTGGKTPPPPSTPHVVPTPVPVPVPVPVYQPTTVVPPTTVQVPQVQIPSVQVYGTVPVPRDVVVVQTEPYIPPDCRSTLLQMGHSASQLMFCDDVNQACAVTLLETGNSPSELIFCDVSDEACAVTMLQNGGHPSELIFCD